jgi:UDP-N-acetylglucosamine:LPS N-acetylglucosamine transferase
MGSRPRTALVLVCSSGGHLTQLYNLKPWWDGFDRLWVTFNTPDASSRLERERVVWAHHPTTRNIGNLVRNTFLAWRTLRHARPRLVISTGAAVAFPFFLIAKLRGIDTVYIEVLDRIDSATLTGRLCYPLSDLFLVQWEEQKNMYPRAQLVGPLL